MHGGLNLAAGRKRNPNVIRDKNGKSRGEPLRVCDAVKAVRERHVRAAGIKPEHALDPLAGFTLGLLLLRGRVSQSDPGSVSQAQYDAGESWCKIVHRHASIMGYSLTTPSPSFAMVGGGRGSGADPDEEVIDRVRDNFTKCYNALMFQSREHNAPIWRVAYAVVIENQPVRFLTGLDYGHLRTGLNALARVLN